MKKVAKIVLMSALTLSITAGSLLTGNVQAKASTQDKTNINMRDKQLELQKNITIS